MSSVLLGGAIGDALGVAFESKPATYQPLLEWDGKTFLGSEHHNLPPTCYSDDTQLSICVAQSLINSHGFDPDDLAKRYVELFTSKTIRGYGTTTLLAINNLIAKKHWSASGVPGSYGNGSSMRAAPFGVFFRNDLQSLVAICKIDSGMTHASEEAEAGSIAIALAAAYAVNGDTQDLLTKICEQLPDSKVKSSVFSLTALLESKQIAPSVALRVLGTRCDVRETVPSALYLFCRMANYEEAVVAAIRGGFDTDTLGAIVGSLFSSKDGMKGIPQYWIDNVEDGEKLIALDSQLYNRSNNNYLPVF